MDGTLSAVLPRMVRAVSGVIRMHTRVIPVLNVSYGNIMTIMGGRMNFCHMRESNGYEHRKQCGRHQAQPVSSTDI